MVPNVMAEARAEIGKSADQTIVIKSSLALLCVCLSKSSQKAYASAKKNACNAGAVIRARGMRIAKTSFQAPSAQQSLFERSCFLFHLQKLYHSESGCRDFPARMVPTPTSNCIENILQTLHGWVAIGIRCWQRDRNVGLRVNQALAPLT